MSVDRKAFNFAIAELNAANKDHKHQRSLYMAEIRKLGTDLRKKLCQKGGLTAWIQTNYREHQFNPNKYGVGVSFEGNNPECVDAIVKHMTEEGWTCPGVYSTSEYATQIEGY